MGKYLQALQTTLLKHNIANEDDDSDNHQIIQNLFWTNLNMA